MISLLRGLIMPDDSVPPADKAVTAFFEIIAFALGWGGVERLLGNIFSEKPLMDVLPSALPIFAVTILLSYTGFKWPQIKGKIGNRLGPSGQYRPILAVVALLLLTAYEIHDRHVSGMPALVPWWHYGPLLLGVLAVIWLMVGGLPKTQTPAPTERPPKEPSKLVIHSALYGAGGFKDVSLADQLNDARRDALVIPVDNNLVSGSPDPAPNQAKRLEVKYSYGNAVPRTVSRNEHSILVLPEDSEIERLTGDVKTLADALAQARTPQQPQNTGRRYPRQVFTIQRVKAEPPSVHPNVYLKNKVRMILTNHLDRDVCVWTPLWQSHDVRPDGSPPSSRMQLEGPKGWQSDDWGGEETCATVAIGRTFACYIALLPTSGESIERRVQAGRGLGYALFPVKIDGILYEVPVGI